MTDQANRIFQSICLETATRMLKAFCREHKIDFKTFRKESWAYHGSGYVEYQVNEFDGHPSVWITEDDRTTTLSGIKASGYHNWMSKIDAKWVDVNMPRFYCFNSGHHE